MNLHRSTLHLIICAGLLRFPGDLLEFHATHQVPAEHTEMLLASEEHLAGVNVSGFPPAVLHLKIGCLLICIRNCEFAVVVACGMPFCN